MSAFAQGLACVLVLMLLQQACARNRLLSRILLGVACFTAPLLFACLLLGTRAATVGGESGQRALDFQHSGGVFVTFIGLQKPLSEEFRIGGRADSDFLIDRVPGNVATIGADRLLRPLTVDTQGDHYSATEGELADLTEQGTIATWRLRPGSKLCLARAGAEHCDADRSWVWTVGNRNDLSVIAPGSSGPPQAACVLTDFINAFAIQSLLGRVPTAGVRIFPLDIYGRPACAGTAVELDAVSTLRQTFLHFDARGGLYVSQLPIHRDEHGLIVEQGERIVAARSETDFRFTVFRLHTSSPLPQVEPRPNFLRSDRAETGRSRLVTISRINAEFPAIDGADGHDAIRVIPVRPAVKEVSPALNCRQSTIVNLMGSWEGTRPRPREVSEFETAIRVPFLADMGRIGATGSFFEIERGVGAVSPWQAHGCLTFSRANISLSGAIGSIVDIQGSDVLSLGSQERGLLLMSAAEYGVPTLWVLALLFAVAALRVLIRWTWWKQVSHAALIGAVLIVVDTLLLIRFTAAVQEVAARPFFNTDVSGALLVLLLVPLFLDALVAVMNHMPPRARRVGALGYRRPWVPIGQAGRGLRSRSSAVRLWALVSIVPVLHLGLVMIGIREQVAGIRLTAVLVPIYIILFAIFVAAACAPKPSTSIQRHPWLGLMICGALAVSAFGIARDIGAVITLIGALVALTVMVTVARVLPGRPVSRMHALLAYGLLVLVALMLSASMLLYAGGSGVPALDVLQQHPALRTVALTMILIGIFSLWRWNSTKGWLFAAPGAIVLLVLLTVSTSHFEQQSEDCTDADLRRVAACLDRHSMSTNRLRLSYLLYPQLARLNLTGEARGMNAVFDELRWVITEFKGQGFMSVPPRMGLDEHDNVIASHLIGPQGRASAILLCALLIVPLLFVMVSKHHRRVGLQRPLTWLAYSCLAFTSVYMILGNLLLVPFTGRNVYLTNPLSGTDLLEGGLLVLLAIAPLACARRGEIHEH